MKKIIKIFGFPIIEIEELTEAEAKHKQLEKKPSRGEILDIDPKEFEKDYGNPKKTI